MKLLLLVGILALSFGQPACADLKVALIDTGKAFDAFYKTKDMATKIAARKTTFEKEIRDLQAEYDSSSQEVQELANAVKDTSSPLDVRKSKDATLAQKVEDLKSIEGEIEQRRRSSSQEIKDELIRSHQEIADAMMKIITAYVTAQGYDLVLDKSSASSTAPSLFPYKSGQIADLTEEIIVRLNASAPATH